MGEGDDGTSIEGAWLSTECSTSTVSGGEAKALDSGGEVDAEGSRVERFIVSMIPSIARVMAGLGKVTGVWWLSVAIWSMGCREKEDIMLFRGGASVRHLST